MKAYIASDETSKQILSGCYTSTAQYSIFDITVTIRTVTMNETEGMWHHAVS